MAILYNIKSEIMHLKNNTINQHFISQAEQRLNSINPNAPNDKQKLYSFAIADRENYLVNIENEKGTKIINNLSENDLFTFNTIDKKIRENFELLFSKYETSIFEDTKNLLNKLTSPGAPIQKEVLNIFALKYINFMRNPYSIKKVLNTIGIAATYYPLVSPLSEIYQKITISGKKHIGYLCEKYQFSESEYLTWLKSIFLLLMRKEHESNIIELVIKDLFENKESFICIFIFAFNEEHSEKCPLISDRGFSMPNKDLGNLSFSFNLSSNAFINYSFLDMNKLDPKQYPKQIIEAIKSKPKEVLVSTFWNNLDALESFNKNVIYQSHSRVFSKSKIIYGI